MPAKLSEKVCPVCNQPGGFQAQRPVKYTINVPPRKKIKTLVAAWDYGARVCLKFAESIMLFPPSMSVSMANSNYDFWRRINLHNDIEIELIEAKLMKAIPKSLRSRTKYLNSKYSRSREFYDKTLKHIRDPIHIHLPEESGVPTKASVGFVYAACICLRLRDAFGQVSFENNDQLIRGIYTYFSLFHSMTDDRVFESWSGYFKICNDIQKYGYYRASRLAKQVSNICKHCLQKKKITVEMSRDLDTQSWKCSNCGGNTPVVLHFSITHLKRKEREVREKASDVVKSIPIFLESLNWIINYLKLHPLAIIALRTLFNKYALEAEKGTLFATKRYFWGHYDNTKKSKKRWCPLKTKGIEDTSSKGNVPLTIH